MREGHALMGSRLLRLWQTVGADTEIDLFDRKNFDHPLAVLFNFFAIFADKNHGRCHRYTVLKDRSFMIIGKPIEFIEGRIVLILDGMLRHEQQEPVHPVYEYL